MFTQAIPNGHVAKFIEIGSYNGSIKGQVQSDEFEQIQNGYKHKLKIMVENIEISATVIVDENGADINDNTATHWYNGTVGCYGVFSEPFKDGTRILFCDKDDQKVQVGTILDGRTYDKNGGQFYEHVCLVRCSENKNIDIHLRIDRNGKNIAYNGYGTKPTHDLLQLDP